MVHNIDLDMDSIPDKVEDVPEEITTMLATIDTALMQLCSSLSVKFTDYASKRTAKEEEWVQAERQYSGSLDIEDDKKLRALGGSRAHSSPPIVNITRPKTNIAIARMQDIQFPLGGNYNFILEPTEVPELRKALKDDTPVEEEQEPEEMSMAGTPMAPMDPTAEEGPPPEPTQAPTIADIARSIMSEAKEAATAMQTQIRDRLTEASYGKKARNSMDDMCRLGTAVIKGPVHKQKIDRKYDRVPTSDGDSIEALTLTERTIPSVQWVDPRLVYPDPDARPGTDMEDIFEVHLMTARTVSKLASNPAFMRERVRKVLGTEPDISSLGSAIQSLSLVGSAGTRIQNRYAVKEYHGSIDKQVLLDVGLISEEQKEDSLFLPQGEVWFCNNHVIRISLSPLEADDSVPYFFCTWEDDKSSIFGHGIPYLMRHAQRVVNSSWLMLLDNAGLTAGPQIVLNREMIRPASPEEGWRIEPMKVWFMTEYGANVQEAMQFVNVPTQQESIANITELAMTFADIESAIPAIQSGEMPSGNNTLGGVAMVLTASHIVQQRVSERWDDNITVPLIRRFYDWEMQYSEDENIRRGDLNVKVGGATERIDKQVKAQDIERILGLAGSNPDFQKHIDADAAFRELVATTRAGDIILSLEEVARREQEAAAQQQEAPPDAETIKAQAAMLSAQVKQQALEINQQMAQAELEMNSQISQAKLENERIRMQATQQEGFMKVQLAQMDREQKLLELAAKGEMTQSELTQKLQIAVMTEETKRILKEADISQFREELSIKREMGTGI